MGDPALSDADPADAQQATALELHAAGVTFARIAAQLGISTAKAKAWVADALDSTASTPEAARQPAAARYDAMWGRAWSVLVSAKGEPEAVLRALDRCMGIAERRARLLGLDAPPRRPVRGDP